MSDLGRTPSRRRRLVWCLGLALAYVALGRLSYALSALEGVGAAALWLPCGLSVAAMLLLGRWVWPGVFLGAWTLNGPVMDGPSALALPFAFGNTLEAVAAGHLFRRYANSEDIFESAENFAVLVFSILFGNSLSVFFGVGALILLNATEPPLLVPLLTWWMGNLSGAMLVIPLIYAWRNPDFTDHSLGHLSGYAILLFATALLEVMIFEQRLPAIFVLLPFLLWSALQYGAAGTTFFGTLVVAIAMWETTHGKGQFAVASPAVSMIVTQLFSAVFLITAFVVMSQNRAGRRLLAELQRNAALLEQKVSERTDQLARKEAHLARAQAIAHVGSWEWAHDENTWYWSDETKRILGFPLVADPRYVDFFARVHPDDRNVLRAARVALTEPGGRIDIQYRVLSPDGQIRHVHERGERTHAGDGRPGAASGTLMDITTQKRNELELTRLAFVARETRSAVLITDRDGVIEWVNPAFTRLTQYTAAEVVGRKPGLLLRGTATSPRTVRFLLREVARRRKSHISDSIKVEILICNREGREYWVELEVIGSYGPGGLERFFSIQHDITARKEYESRLRSLSDRLKATVDAAMDCIIVVDHEGRILEFNPAAETCFGYRRDDIIGEPVTQLIIPPGYPAADGQGLEHYLSTGVANLLRQRNEVSGMRADGSAFPAELSIDVATSEAGKIFVGFLRDITERKQTELALQVAKERAESANRAKSEFLANMSHEIRTPLNGVLAAAELLLSGGLTAEHREYAEIIHHSGESLLTILNDILDFSKIEAGKLELERIDFDLHDSLDALIRLAGLKAQEKNLELICDFAADLPTRLRGDPLRLRQILMNLLSNAIKFTEEGEITLRVRVDSEDEQFTTLFFCVSDTGIGIAPDRQAGLFKPFMQVDGAITRKYGGTGLGLAIARTLVNLMQGEIGSASALGAGSQFWFTAVFEKQHAGTTQPYGPTQLPAAPSVLLVGGNNSQIAILAEWLTSWGCACHTASSRHGALLRLEEARRAQQSYRFAIVDLGAADLDELVRYVDAGERLPLLESTKWIALTSYGGKAQLTALRSAGIEACLTKPITPSRLFDCLAAFLSGSPQHQETAPRNLSAPGDAHISTSRKVLLAEDNAINRRVTLAILAKLGYTADAVENGRECLEQLAQRDYDLVLMDCQMPEVDGYSASRRIRDPESGVRNHDIPIIALTAHAMRGDRERCLAAGMDDYLTKPLDVEALRSALDRWLPEPQSPPAPVANDEVPARSIADIRVFDAAALHRRVLHDEDLYWEVINSFCEDLPGRIEQLRTALAAGDLPAVQRQAHTIKGTAANVAADALSALALSIEQAADTGSAELLRLTERLQPEFERLRLAVAPPDTGPTPTAGAERF
ncbi:PAS domain S-box protein [Methylolobus aquaticus]|nr:PAS domain S-box protein [Methylolobus aquaticus]